MSKYILKRLLQFIPTMFIISLLSFYISINSPGDPVEILSQSSTAQGGASSSYAATKQYKDSVRVQLGLDLPLFYFSLNTKSDCDTLYKILDKQDQYTFHRLSRKFGDWHPVAVYYKTIDLLNNSYTKINVDSIDAANTRLIDTTTELITLNLKTGEKMNQRRLLNSTKKCDPCKAQIEEKISTATNISQTLKKVYQPDFIIQKIDTLIALTSSVNFLSTQQKIAVELKKEIVAMEKNTTQSSNYIPQIAWYGLSNQYHKWLVNLLHGNFGYSYTDTRPVAEKIWQKFSRSLVLVLLSIILAYLISIPIGIYSAKKRGSFFDGFSSVILFLLYSIPTFFFGTILLYFFSNPQYFSWFPESGYCDPENYDNSWSIFQKIYYTFPYMVLPLLTYTYASFAFLSRIIRSATLEILSQDFVRTARAKGLSENKVIWKHVLRNALLPIITTFVNVFPAAIGGSVIIETIFTYDGMGIAGYEAIGSKDIPMIVSIFTLAGFMSMIAYFIADILYAMVDPRIKFNSSN